MLFWCSRKIGTSREYKEEDRFSFSLKNFIVNNHFITFGEFWTILGSKRLFLGSNWIKMPLFQRTIIKKHLLELNNKEIDSAYGRFTAYFHNPTIQSNIRNSKEEQFQEGFFPRIKIKQSRNNAF